eukprot:scaffold16620_cov58-Phaeocystis_antarctica.AAC.2
MPCAPHAGGIDSSAAASSATVSASARQGQKASRAVASPILRSLARSRPRPARSMMVARAHARSLFDHQAKAWPRSAWSERRGSPGRLRSTRPASSMPSSGGRRRESRFTSAPAAEAAR